MRPPLIHVPFRPSEPGEPPVRGLRYALPALCRDRHTAVVDLAALLGAEEGAGVLPGRPATPGRLPQEGPQGAELALLPHELAHPLRAEGADQLVLQVRRADEDAVASGAGPLPPRVQWPGSRSSQSPSGAGPGRAGPAVRRTGRRPPRRPSAARGHPPPPGPGRDARPACRPRRRHRAPPAGRRYGQPRGRLARGVTGPARRPRVRRVPERVHVTHGGRVFADAGDRAGDARLAATTTAARQAQRAAVRTHGG